MALLSGEGRVQRTFIYCTVQRGTLQHVLSFIYFKFDLFLLLSPKRNPPTFFYRLSFSNLTFYLLHRPEGTSQHVLSFIYFKFDLLSTAQAKAEPSDMFYRLSISNLTFHLVLRPERNFSTHFIFYLF